MNKETKIETKEEKPVFKRPKSKLLNSTGPLSCKSIPGYHLRWVSLNDPQQPQNMQWAYDQGYDAVKPEEQNMIKESAYTKDLGSDIRVTGRDGITQVLMKQPIDYYEESIKELTDYNHAQVSKKDTSEDGKAFGTFGKTVTTTISNVKGV
jgi:hypothetical protein